MYPIRSLREGTGLLATGALLILLAFQFAGCSSDESSPTANGTTAAPVLPATDQLQFDFSFFDAAASLDKGTTGQHDNFLNAYLRTVVLDAMAKLVLAAPVAAFSAAVHTVPLPQDDGSWVWLYTWHQGPDQVGIILRGKPAGTVVEWELSLVAKSHPTGVLWFSGATSGAGNEGHWVFHDLDHPDNPVSGEINWGPTAVGRFLEFVCLEPAHDGDRLRFQNDFPDFAITFTPGDGAAASFIRWDVSGAGSLQVPDHNGGQEACWDSHLLDTVCP